MKKGFTLIELLAVIVVISIISVIAIATIRGVVEKAKKNSALDSAYGYMDAMEKRVLINEMNDDEDIVDGIYKDVNTLKNTYKVTVKGQYPDMTVIKILKGKINYADFLIGKYYIECFSSTNCRIKDGKTKISADQVEITGIEGIENVQQALDDLREKLS